MDTILIVLGVLGIGAIVISAYVFTVAARHYVSDNNKGVRNPGDEPFGKILINRNPTDRRSGQAVTFPLMVNGTLIPQDRRVLPDRRMDAA